MAETSNNSGHRALRFALTLLALIALAALITVLLARNGQRQQETDIQLRNKSTIDLIVRTLRSEMGEVRGDTLVLAQPPIVTRMLAAPDDATRTRVDKLLAALARIRGNYAQVRLIDAGGREVARVDRSGAAITVVPVGQLQDKHHRPYVEATSQLEAGQVYVSRLDLNIEHGQIQHPLLPTLRLATPVFGADGRRLGMVVINLDGRRMLASIAHDAQLASGAIWLVDREGDWLVGPDLSRDWRFMVPGQARAGLATDLPAVWDAVRSRDNGQMRGAFGLLSFDRVMLGEHSDPGRPLPQLRVLALAPRAGLAAILLDRSHLLVYAVLLPILLLLAGWVSYLLARLARARGEIAGNSRLLQDIFEHSSLSMKVKDLQGRILRANGAAARLLGRDVGQLIGQPIDVVATEETAALVHAHDHEVIEGNRVSNYEEQVAYLGGAYTLLTTRFPVTDERGRVVGVGAVSLDITERNHMEEWLRLAKNQAEAANRAKSTFLASMSHELRTPLNSIIGLGELLFEQVEENPGNPLSKESLRRIVGAGRHLLALINDILDIAKVEAGHIDLRPEPLLARSLIESVFATLKPLAVANGDELLLDVRGEPGILDVDALRMRQILINLVGNAIKFTRDGRVTLRVDREDDMLRIAVSDTGIGMTQEQLTRIFEPFEQADRSISRTHGGSGLGLAISRQLAELMGGRIDVASAPGQGSVFTLVLPVNTPAQRASGPATSGASGASSLPRRAVALVVDDDADARDLLRSLLERDGVHVITAASGAEALVLARRERPAVMVLDILLGDMSGWDVLTVLRADPDHADLPVILCTITDPDHRTVSLGVIEHLTKPIDRDQLKKLVRRFVGTEQPVEVLVVDDDDVYREQMALALRHEGHRVRMASSGELALQQMRQQAPDLLLLDLVMPGIDGLAVIATMRDERALAEIPVVLITAADVPLATIEQLYNRAILLVRKDASDLAGVARRVGCLFAQLGATGAAGRDPDA